MPVQFSRRAAIALPLLAIACKPRAPEAFMLSGQTMGTTFNVTAPIHGDAAPVSRDQFENAVHMALDEVNAAMSNWDPASEISRFNARRDTEAMALSPLLSEVIGAAVEVHEASAGRFDTTLGPLIELWGFGAPGARDMPEAAAIAAALARSGHANSLHYDGRNLRKRHEDAQVYLAAIGKGFGADHVGRALQALGLRNYLIEIGGDLLAMGRNADGVPWQIGIEVPTLAGGLKEVVSITNMGLASSGDYRNYKEYQGQRYTHIIDPMTGRPITHKTAATTVIAQTAMLADAWATAMLTLGSARGLEIAAQNDIAVMFLDRNSEISDIRFERKVSARFEAIT